MKPYSILIGLKKWKDKLIINSKNEIKIAILEGLKVSSQKLIASKILLGRKLVISENGIIKEIDPKELK